METEKRARGTHDVSKDVLVDQAPAACTAQKYIDIDCPIMPKVLEVCSEGR